MGSLAGELAIQGPPRAPGFAQSQPLRHCGREDECFVQRLLTSYCVRPRAGGGDAGVTRPSGCGFRLGCFTPSTLGQGPHLPVRISSGMGEQLDAHPRVTLKGPGQVGVGSHSEDGPLQDGVAVVSPGRGADPDAVAAAGT